MSNKISLSWDIAFSSAISFGRKKFHLFYLCAKYGNIEVEELHRIIRWYSEKRKTLGPKFLKPYFP
jgi:hypothetical protein